MLHEFALSESFIALRAFKVALVLVNAHMFVQIAFLCEALPTSFHRTEERLLTSVRP